MLKDSNLLIVLKARFSRSTKPPRICVIGAGISGLRCADILLTQGFDVTILEARGRIGGRTHQTILPSGQKIDLGPNWIHGTDNNPILDIAKATGTATHTWEDNVNVFGEDGQLVPDRKALSEAMWGIIGQAFKHSAKHCSVIDKNESLSDYFVSRLEELFPRGEGSEEERKMIMQ